MSGHTQRRKTILMIGYTYYEIDPRVIREAEAAVDGGFDVDVLALRRPGSPETEMVRGVRVIRVNQSKYRGKTRLQIFASVSEFLSTLFRENYCAFLQAKVLRHSRQ